VASRSSALRQPRRKPRSVVVPTGEAENDGALALDRVIHERTRLGIVSALAVNSALSFTELKHLLKITDGNLSVHARKLEQASYVTVHKFFDGRVPRTEFKLTASGRRALEAYLNHMEALIRTTRQGESEAETT